MSWTVSTMVRIQVTEHRLVNIRRSSLCDNCCMHNCTSFNGSRITECLEFRPVLSVFLKCRECGRIYDPTAACAHLITSCARSAIIPAREILSSASSAGNDHPSRRGRSAATLSEQNEDGQGVGYLAHIPQALLVAGVPLEPLDQGIQPVAEEIPAVQGHRR